MKRPYPKLRKVFSTRIRCSSCHAWYVRIPKWADLDKGDQCSKCGSTSFRHEDGRPFGPRSRYWKRLEHTFREFCKYDCFACYDAEEIAYMLECDDMMRLSGPPGDEVTRGRG